MTRALLVLTVLLFPGRSGDLKPSGVPTRPCSAQDSSGLLRPSDAGFADAQQFSRFLTGQGFVVNCVIRSTFQSFIWDWPEAAFLTDRGDLEVRFFPPPSGAAQLRVEEARSGSGWRYSFPGHPGPGDTMYAMRRQYFVAVGRWLVLVTDPKIAALLRRALPTLSTQMPTPGSGHQPGPLIGTWRLVEFWDRDSLTAPFIYPYGKRPVGYFSYDVTGHVSIQIMRGPDSFRVDSTRGESWFLHATPEELRRAVQDYRAYFGTYAVDSAHGIVLHQVEGDSRGLYTGSLQRRRFRLVGDSLIIGNDTTARRVLLRVP